MNCDEVRVQISDLVDDDLEAQQAQVIHDHLASCSSCTRFYEEKLKVASWLKEAENFQLDPPPAIWQEIDSKISAKPKTSPKRDQPSGSGASRRDERLNSNFWILDSLRHHCPSCSCALRS